MDTVEKTDTTGQLLGAFFGLFTVFYLLVALFITVLVIIFIFKSFGYMKRKNHHDHIRNALLQQLVELQAKQNNNTITNTPPVAQQSSENPSVELAKEQDNKPNE
ncbi:hypothetical protein A374_13475 [Fictibacillus macauensis ZFHKF-1]|uniref:Uncharacterized protein n=1 Tax=Fictibacillus macauensis ZFHKF-1 TaxID=1196324 RepID=I8UCQ3_9BACL|nr:hypothetical protein [Fictibacillus macauensis]EIT84705.1 hypothetical protein A374_13475 [Fictibacillus macauensis ZFHKF-1]